MTNKTRIPIQSRGIIKKEQIIDSAMMLFSDKGYYSINSKDIAREADVSIGTFYAYFKDKKEVFLFLLDGYKMAITESVDSLMPSSIKEIDLPVLIDKIVVNIIDIIETYPKGFYNQVLVLSKTDVDIKHRYNEHLEGIKSHVKALLDITIWSKSIDNDALASYIVWQNESVVHMIISEDDAKKKVYYLKVYGEMLSDYLGKL